MISKVIQTVDRNPGFSLRGINFPGRFFLAPMAGVGDRAFRRLCVEMGADAVVSEMISAKAVTYNNPNTLLMMEKDPVDVPQALQLFGAEPDVIVTAMARVRSIGWEWIDLNAGCPVRKVTKSGAGAALLKDLGLLREILLAMRENHAGLLSLKVRSAWSNESDPVRMVEAVGRLVDDVGVDMVTLHARTRSQGYSGHADWGLIKVLKLNTGAFVVGNGDVKDLKGAVEMRETTGCDAVMIGRAAMGRPWVFTGAEPPGDDRFRFIVRHFDLLLGTFGNDESLTSRVFRRHLAGYAKGVMGASRIRWDGVRVASRADVVAVARRIGDAVRRAEDWA